MKHKNSYGIIGSKAYLKVLEQDELEKIFRWKNDYELCNLINAHPLPIAKYETEEWFKKNQSDKNQILFGIHEIKSKELIGIVRLMFIDWITSAAELGIFIGDKTVRGKGIGQEVMKLILDYAFQGINLRRIYLKVSESNTRALSLYQSVGFIKEGVLRKHFWINGEYQNIVLVGILKNEYCK